MISNDADNDEGLTDDRPFAPLYPVLNFGTPNTFINLSETPSSQPTYDLTNHQYDFVEKKM